MTGRRREPGGHESGARTTVARELARREFLAMGAGAIAAYGIGSPTWLRFRARAESGQQLVRFFSDAERAQARVLADMIIPRDARSVSATEAGSLDYTEFVLAEASDQVKQIWRAGLLWFDTESARRFQRTFVQCDVAQRGVLLDDIAWPAKAAPEFRDQAAFFTRARDLTAAGFFSSKAGVADLGYIGNDMLPEWTGAPEQALRELGVSYAEWDAKYAPRR